MQKPSLKYIKNETISHFKKFMSKIYKKDEESVLNKKKKREEVKQKNKLEKTKINIVIIWDYILIKFSQ